MAIKSTYNFIPAPEEKEVFKPTWAEKANHDVPFSDGESGEISIKITAQTPIFIKNGHGKGTKEREFSHFGQGDDKTYFIPATSFKGVIRNVLEIMSFSRLKAKDDIFSFRSIDHNEFMADQRKIKSGWLYKDNDNEWHIQECRHDNVTIKSINSYFNVNIWGDNAVEKYKKIKDENEIFQKITGYFEEQLGFTTRSGRRINTTISYSLEENKGNTQDGHLVMYGSIENKKREYIFHSLQPDGIYDVSQDLLSRFEDIDKKLPKETASLWNYFKEEGVKRIPVFFTVSADGENVKNFGFSKLYKRNNTKRLHELSPIKTYKSQTGKDLAETMFGNIDDSALKGRVYFGHCKAEGKPIVLGEKTAILSSPKASYYPFYVKDGKPYTTAEEISGFKKYPVHQSAKPYRTTNDEQDTEKLETTFRPLKDGTTFVGKIRFHNLKKMEIGALLSALTFHNQSDKYSHTIGGAKPYGYGKVKVEVTGLEYLQSNVEDYLMEFEAEMDKHCRKAKRNSWYTDNSLLLLFGMSKSEVSRGVNANLVYPNIEPDNEFNDYTHLPNEHFSNVKIQSVEKQRIQVLESRYNEDYKKIENSNDWKEIEMFLKKYSNFPNHNHLFDLNKKLEKLKGDEVLKTIDNNNIKQIEKFIEDFPEHPKVGELRLKIEQHRSQENKNSRAKISLEKFNSYRFEDIKKELNKRFRRRIELSEEQKKDLVKALGDSWNVEINANEKNNAYFRRGQVKPFEGYPWSTIKLWIGDEKAQELFNELTKND